MSRVALGELIFEGTVPASFAFGRSVTVCARGTETPAVAFSAETGGAEVTQPLITNRLGVAESATGEGVWVEPGSYDIRIAPESAGEGTQVLHWEAALGSASGPVTEANIAEEAVSTGKLKNLAVTAAKIAASTIETAKIAAGAVTEEKLGLEAVGEGKIKALAVSAGKLATNAVEAAKIKAEAVTTEKLANLAVTATKLGNESVETGKLKALAVTAATIAGETITGAKIALATITDNKLAKPVIGGSVTEAGVVQNGEGFAAERTATGVYKITLSPELATVGVMTVTSQLVGAEISAVSAPSKKVFEVKFFSTALAAKNANFNFQIKQI